VLEARGALALNANAKLVNRDSCAAWETELQANSDVSEENEALLQQKDPHLPVEIWSGSTQFLSFPSTGI